MTKDPGLPACKRGGQHLGISGDTSVYELIRTISITPRINKNISNQGHSGCQISTFSDGVFITTRTEINASLLAVAFSICIVMTDHLIAAAGQGGNTILVNLS
jgi:hypothetical protein